MSHHTSIVIFVVVIFSFIAGLARANGARHVIPSLQDSAISAQEIYNSRSYLVHMHDLLPIFIYTHIIQIYMVLLLAHIYI